MGCPCKDGEPVPRASVSDRLDHLEDVQHNLAMVVLAIGVVVYLLWARSGKGED
jgi:hypothetical protein